MTAFIRGAPEGLFLGIIIFAFGLLAAALYFFWRSLHQGRLMEDMPTSLIRSAAQGYVELDGRARMMKGDPILAPLSRQRCVWWEYKITETRRDSQGRVSRRVIQKQAAEMLGEDGARILHSHRHRWSGSHRWPQAGYKHGVLSLFGRYHYEERLIKVNDPLFCIGYFRTQSAVQGHFDQKAELNELLREWKQDQALLEQRFDVNKDGRIDAKEWEAARRVALKQLRREQFEQQMPQGLHVLSRPVDKRPYIISGISQDKLILRSRLMCFAALVSFLGTIGFLVWALNLRSL